MWLQNGVWYVHDVGHFEIYAKNINPMKDVKLRKNTKTRYVEQNVSLDRDVIFEHKQVNS